ncbi:MAG: ATP-binding protein, partial [Thermoplasmata archaeon]
NTASKRSTLLILEEADRYVPQSGGRRVTKLYDIARRGRKRGIGMIVASQRPQAVDKNILSQCNNQMIGKLRLPNDLDAVDSFFSSKSDLRSLSRFKAGEFFVMGEISPGPARVQVKLRETCSLGATPKVHRTENFNVSDFISNEEDWAGKGVAQAQPEAPIPRRAPAHLDETDDWEEPAARPPNRGSRMLAGVPFSLPEARALEKARSEVKLNLLGKPRETIERIQTAYWPFLVCEFVQVERNMLGKVRKREYISVWDTLKYRVARFKQNNDLAFSRPFDKALSDFLNRKPRRSDDDWKCVRLLNEMQKRDLSAHDMVSRLPDLFTTRTVNAQISKLQASGCIIKSGSAGKAALYRPAVKMPPNLDMKDFETLKPETEEIPPDLNIAVIKQTIQAHGVASIAKGYADNVEMVNASVFHFPVYVVSLADKKKGSSRALVLNGCTGNALDIDGLEPIFENV